MSPRKLWTRARVGLAILLLVALCIGGYVWLAHRPRPPQPSQPAEIPGLHLAETRLVGRFQGRRQWEMLSQQVSQMDEKVYLDDIGEMVFFQDDQPNLRLRAATAVWDRTSEDLELGGGVEIWDDQDFTLTTDRLLWLAAQEELYAPNPVKIMLGSDTTVTAAKMTASSPQETVSLDGDVMIRQDQAVWTMPRAIYDLNNEILYVYGSAVAEFALEAERGEN